MKKKKNNKINCQVELDNFELGQIETCNFIIENLKKELQRLRNFDIDDLLRQQEKDIEYITKYKCTLTLNSFFLNQVEKYKEIILKGE